MNGEWALIEPTSDDTGKIRRVFPSELAAKEWYTEHRSEPAYLGWWIHPCDDLGKAS